MAITDLTGTKWLLEQGWTATSGFGQFSLDGVIYDTNDSLDMNSIDFFNIGYRFQDWTPTPYSNNIIVNGYPTSLTPAHYYEFEITGGADVTNTALINWLETNATLVYQPTKTISDKLQELLDIKQDIKGAIENKGADLTGVDFGGYAGKIGEIQTGGGGLTGGYNVVYRSDYFMQVPSSISITLTFVDDTTASHEIIIGSNTFPSDWEHYVGDTGNGDMVFGKFAPYVWNNVKSVSITARADSGSPYLVINDVNVGSTYNVTLNKNIFVTQAGGQFGW